MNIKKPEGRFLSTQAQVDSLYEQLGKVRVPKAGDESFAKFKDVEELDTDSKLTVKDVAAKLNEILQALKG